MKIESVVVLTVAFFAAISVVFGETLSYNKVQIIDYSAQTGNFLFRGNEPINSSNEFAYEQLTSFFQQRAQEANITFPSSYYLVDISFLNKLKTSERKNLETETKFFAKNPRLGELVHWMLMGTPVEDPNLYKNQTALLEKAADLPNWMHDKLPQGILKVRSQLLTKGKQPIVMYAHCEGGADRTGEFSAAYYMQYQNMTLASAFQLDDQIAGRQIHLSEQWAAEWYCWYLASALDFDLTCQSS